MAASCVTRIYEHSLQQFVSALANGGWHNKSTLQQLLRADDPLVTCLTICAATMLLCWVFQILTRNCSHVDRLWSILPLVYCTVLARQELLDFVAQLLGGSSSRSGLLGGHHQPDTRLLIQWALVCVWGVRLTLNFARKGGYSLHYEDYRWEHVRKLMSAPMNELLNLVFVAGAQNVLLLGLALPAAVASYTARTSPGVVTRGASPLNAWDYAAIAGFIVFWLCEVIADQQQWRFQNAKHAAILARKPRTGDMGRGFLTTGMFRFSRHPAWFCENCIWYSFSLFSIGAVISSGCGGGSTSSTGSTLPSPLLLAIVLAPPIMLTALFQGSIWITEKISVSRYPQHYPRYQRVTSSFLPLPPRSSLRDE